MQQTPEVEALLREMGITLEDFRYIREAPSLAEGIERLKALQDKFKKAFSKMALKLHPDHTGGDPTATERFRLLCKLKEDIAKLTLSPQPPPVPFPVRPFQQVVVVQYYSRGGFVSDSGTSPSPAQRAYRTATLHPGTGTFFPGVIFRRAR